VAKSSLAPANPVLRPCSGYSPLPQKRTHRVKHCQQEGEWRKDK
jgi:hypothetical protein